MDNREKHLQRGQYWPTDQNQDDGDKGQKVEEHHRDDQLCAHTFSSLLCAGGVLIGDPPGHLPHQLLLGGAQSNKFQLHCQPDQVRQVSCNLQLLQHPLLEERIEELVVHIRAVDDLQVDQPGQCPFHGRGQRDSGLGEELL